MRKTLVILLILFITTISFSQNFNGDFRSFKTSFKDISNPSNNFTSNSEFRIAVMIDKNQDDGSIVIQDPRIPNKLLVYQVIEGSASTKVIITERIVEESKKKKEGY